MTNEYFNTMKANLVEVYKEDLCEESLADIENATNVAGLIAVLKKYAAFLHYKNIPKIDWVREWFGDYIDEANANGCYIDQHAFVKDPKLDIVLYGDSKVNLCAEQGNIYNVCVQDNSEVYVLAKGISRVNVRVKDNGRCHTLLKERNAVIRVRNV